MRRASANVLALSGSWDAPEQKNHASWTVGSEGQACLSQA